ncbi:MAG: 50S ribosomal protein L24 [Candidatus Omnitrophica bacterium]|nr:50S ribosomal protein L24 [Candidatus Omnitrophota bacterium]
MSLRIKKGDRVFVLAGKDKGKSGKVLGVFPGRQRALVEGVNLVKKHIRKNPQHPQGAIIAREASIHLSNLALLCPVSGKPTRMKVMTAEDGSKQRISAKHKAVIA